MIEVLFPQGRRVGAPRGLVDKYCIPVSGGFWEVDWLELTEREQALILQLTSSHQQGNLQKSSPWQTYLLEGEGALPEEGLQAVQFVHVQVQGQEEQVDSSWQNLLADFFTNLVAQLVLDERQMVLLVNQQSYRDIFADLVDILPALEFDLGLRLSVLVGQVWGQEFKQAWPQLFQAERQLLAGNWPSGCWTLSQLLHRQLSHQAPLSPLFLKNIAQMIGSFEQMEEIIWMMWSEGAVLTKTAQKLYIHRNTLQYRIEKFREQTGLHLKNMDDLSLCHLALLQQEK